ncbi:metallophosphoesterase [Halostagnicola kamekurae]|uniref:Putative phosphoesterase n=1 Tax=Halostagnicola kamekurae TaxID=619731 RepID=A0A1I6UI73_9EURY|nr:metallophosphoesterase [Halostagnicola kamekurae]SFT01169.1 putative phosphoesterase [Halostagnicola kamekurae]
MDTPPRHDSDAPILEPIPGAPAAVATLPDERALVIADYHAGYEAGLRYERGVDVPSQAPDRRERLLELLERTGVDRLVVCGDLMHAIGEPGGAERGELEVLLESVLDSVSVTLVKGNHDGAIETWLEADSSEHDDPGVVDVIGSESHSARLDIHAGTGVRLGPLGVCHGHTWPSADVLEAEVVCFGHEHPCIRLEDEVGGARVEPIWLRGRLDPKPFAAREEYRDLSWLDTGEPPRMVGIPAFNDLVGGTWVNVPGQSFLAPFLPDGIADGEAFLLDGTRLGPFREV